MGNDNDEGDVGSSSGHESPARARIPEQQTAQVSTDTLYRILSSERRRQLLSHLIERSAETVSVDGAVDHVTRDERPVPEPIRHRERVAIDLHHAHLPKLADADVIEHDPVAETIRYDGPEALTTMLAATDEIEAQEE